MPNPINPRVRTAFQKTGNGEREEEQKEEIIESPSEEPQTVVLQIKPAPTGEEPPKKQISVADKKETHQPSTHNMRSPIPYQIRYRKLNAMIDKRLLPYWQHVMGLTGNDDYGTSMTASFNEMFLRFLLQENFDIDPNILKRPFTWEVYADLPPEE